MVYNAGIWLCEVPVAIRITLFLPDVNADVMKPLPRRCPRPRASCAGSTFHRHSRVGKAVRDTRVSKTEAVRYQCTECGYTFRVYPEGVTSRQQSDRLRCLSVLLWTLSLSLGGVVTTLRALGCPLGRTTVYENVSVAGQGARRRMRERLRSGVRVRVLGTDCTHVKVAGKDKVVVQSIDVMAGRTLEVEVLPGEDERTIVRYMSRMAKLTGAEVLVTDDADAFKMAADAVGLKHQVCQQHVVPNTLRLVAEIASDLLGRQDAGTGGKPGDLSSEQAIEDLASLETIILARAPSSQTELEALQQRYQKAPPPGRGKKADSFYRMRLLTMDLAEDWPRLTLNDTYREPGGRRFLPATNNASEQRIGYNIKERYRTMRGYKRTASLRRVPALTAYLRETNDPRALATLLAG
jgi:transposase-like protein